MTYEEAEKNISLFLVIKIFITVLQRIQKSYLKSQIQPVTNKFTNSVDNQWIRSRLG